MSVLFLTNMTLQAVTTMDKPPFRQNQNCGDWELKERLGLGGFAHVYLYQHRVSLERCIIDVCNFMATAPAKDTHSIALEEHIIKVNT